MDIAVLTRPVALDDEVRLHRLWPRLSADTVYRRFHGPVRWLPPETVHRFVDVDHDLREAVVLVEDAWQGHGVGRQLLAELVDLAARRGVTTATASVQADDDRTLALLRRLLPGSRFVPDSAVHAVTGPLPAPRTAAVPPIPDRGDLS